MKDHDEIWLEHPDSEGFEGRQWMYKDIFDRGIRYIRADICNDLNNQLLDRQVSDCKTIIELEAKLIEAEQKGNEYFTKMLKWQEKAMGQYRPGWDEL